MHAITQHFNATLAEKTPTKSHQTNLTGKTPKKEMETELGYVDIFADVECVDGAKGPILDFYNFVFVPMTSQVGIPQDMWQDHHRP
jgi:hypothetical protein